MCSWPHRIREAMREGASDAFTGIVEIDETIYGRAATHPVGRRTKQTRKSQPITNAAHKNVVLSLVHVAAKFAAGPARSRRSRRS